MNLLTRVATRLLERTGHTVLHAEDKPLPIYDIDTAVRFVTFHGYDVTRPQPQLGAGQCWRPQDSAAQVRWVRSVGKDHMSYVTSVDGLPRTVDRATWERWVRKTRAVCL